MAPRRKATGPGCRLWQPGRKGCQRSAVSRHGNPAEADHTLRATIVARVRPEPHHRPLFAFRAVAEAAIPLQKRHGLHLQNRHPDRARSR
jgi:hypothetical protein